MRVSAASLKLLKGFGFTVPKVHWKNFVEPLNLRDVSLLLNFFAESEEPMRQEERRQQGQGDLCQEKPDDGEIP